MAKPLPPRGCIVSLLLFTACGTRVVGEVTTGHAVGGAAGATTPATSGGATPTAAGGLGPGGAATTTTPTTGSGGALTNDPNEVMPSPTSMPPEIDCRQLKSAEPVTGARPPRTVSLPLSVLGPCGNGALDADEECDDGNTGARDGCSSACRIEFGWSCSGARPCTYLARCGDRVLGHAESCDDGNVTSGDGCSADCLVEAGWYCPSRAEACVPRCGDGQVIGAETCDDGNTEAGDGCSARCGVETPTDCDAATLCEAVCGNGVVEGNELCDEGANNVDGFYGGCNTNCTLGPHCGDGILDPFPGEKCDLGTGNDTLYGSEGCTPACTLPHFCGDGYLDAVFCEECDDGANNGAPRTGLEPPCDASCNLVVP